MEGWREGGRDSRTHGRQEGGTRRRRWDRGGRDGRTEGWTEGPTPRRPLTSDLYPQESYELGPRGKAPPPAAKGRGHRKQEKLEDMKKEMDVVWGELGGAGRVNG